MSTGGTTVDYTYDAWGRMSTKDDGTYTALYSFAAAHMLYSVDTDFPLEEDVTLVTGGDGRRRSRTTSSDETWYNWAGLMVISEEDDADGSTGALSRTYVGHTAAHVDGTNPSTGAYKYYTHDHLGSTRRLRDQSKNSDGQYEYTPYGEVYSESGTAITRKYAMLEWDPATQLHFAPFRYYNPAAGRWAERDPLGMVDGTNMYWYAVGNPVNAIDPLGLFTSLSVCIKNPAACAAAAQVGAGAAGGGTAGGAVGYAKCGRRGIFPGATTGAFIGGAAVGGGLIAVGGAELVGAGAGTTAFVYMAGSGAGAAGAAHLVGEDPLAAAMLGAASGGVGGGAAILRGPVAGALEGAVTTGTGVGLTAYKMDCP